MPAFAVKSLFRRLSTLIAAAGADGEHDARLLQRFVTQRDEAAFAALLERHGPMVLGLCRRLVSDEHLAEDVLQATFLVLVRNGHKLRKQQSLGGWLHGVALRLAKKAVAQAMRSRQGDARTATSSAAAADPLADASWREARAVLDEELQRLPAKYRLPLVLCYLESRTRDEAAAELGWTESRLKGMLERAREQLRRRLVQRGVTLSAAGSATLLADTVFAATVPPLLSVSIARAAVSYASGQALAACRVSARVAALTEGGLNIMASKKASLVLALTVVLGALGSGFAVWAQQSAALSETPDAHSAVKDDGKPIEAALPAKAPEGKAAPWPDEVPLPKGAVRLGSNALKFRDGVYGVCFLDDGKQFAAVNHNRIRIFETATGKEVRAWKADDHAILGLAASPDGKLLATAGNNEMICIWETATGKRLREFNEHRGKSVFRLVFSANGKCLASLGDEKEDDGKDKLGLKDVPTSIGVRLHDVTTGKEWPGFEGGLIGGNGPSFSPDGKHIIWTQAVFEADTWKYKQQARALAGGPTIVWNPKDPTGWPAPVAFVNHFTEDGYLRDDFLVWDGKKDSAVQSLKIGFTTPYTLVEFSQVRFSPDRSLIATGGEYGFITFWDPKKGPIRTLSRHFGGVGSLEFSRDGKTLLSGGGYDVRLWDVATGSQLGLVGHSQQVLSVAISADGKTVATTGQEGTLRLWDRASGKQERVVTVTPLPSEEKFPVHRVDHAAVTAVVFLGESKALACAGRDGTVRIWDAAGGNERVRLLAHKEGAHSLALSADGKLLASGGGDGLIRIWDTTTWKEQTRLEGHEARIVSLAFTPDGMLLSGSNGVRDRVLGARRDDSFRLWDLPTGREIRRFKDNQGIGGIAVSPDGKLCLSSSTSRDKGIGFIWRTATGEEHAKLPPLEGGTHVVAFSPNGKLLALGRSGFMRDDNLLLVDTASWQIVADLRGHSHSVSAVRFSADSRYLVSGSDDGSAVAWDLATVEMKR